MAYQSHIAVLMGLRLMGGAASAFVIVLASTLVLARLSAAQRGNLSALHFAGVGVGIMLSAAVVSALLAVERAGKPCGSRPVAWHFWEPSSLPY